MSMLGSTESPMADDDLESSFVIEQGHFGPHLPRPPWELVASLGGAALILLGFYLPWLTFVEQHLASDGGFTGPITTTEFSGWQFSRGYVLSTAVATLSGRGLMALIALPVLAALLALALNILWARRRANGMTCALAICALIVGALVLVVESTYALFLTLLFETSTVVTTVQIGLGLPVMYLGYIALAAANLAICMDFWRHSPPATTG